MEILYMALPNGDNYQMIMSTYRAIKEAEGYVVVKKRVEDPITPDVPSEAAAEEVAEEEATEEEGGVETWLANGGDSVVASAVSNEEEESVNYDPITVNEAMEIMQKSRSSIMKYVASGDLKNLGEHGAPRVCRNQVVELHDKSE